MSYRRGGSGVFAGLESGLGFGLVGGGFGFGFGFCGSLAMRMYLQTDSRKAVAAPLKS